MAAHPCSKHPQRPVIIWRNTLTDVQHSPAKDWKFSSGWNIDRLSSGVAGQMHQRDQ